MLTASQTDQLYHRYPVLNHLDNALCERVLSKASLVTIPAGQMLFTENSACQAFPFILEGAVRVYKISESGRELPLYRVTPGDACVVSSGCLLRRRAYNARGSAQQDSYLVMLPEEDFSTLMAESIFREYIFGLFGERLQELMQLVEEVAFRKLDQRLAKLLLAIGPELNYSHQQLADELGSVREIVSRLLRGFSEAGFISQGREHIRLLKPEELQRIAQG